MNLPFISAMNSVLRGVIPYKGGGGGGQEGGKISFRVMLKKPETQAI